MEINEVRGIIGLFIGFFSVFVMSGWLIYSFYIKPEREERKKR